MAMVGGASLFLAAGVGCPSPAASASQPAATTTASNSIPADYLALFKQVGQQYGVPWVILAGIGKVESNDGQSNLPGVHSGQNGFGAAGPMQIGIGGASGNTWGGAPVHPASEVVSGVATDANGDGIASVYDPADAIAGAAKYLLAQRRAEQSQRGHLRLQPPAVLRAAGGVLGGRVQPRRLRAAPTRPPPSPRRSA